MASIFFLTDDAFLLILKHLDSVHQMTFAFTCQRFREICLHTRIFRKVDLSRSAISRTQRGIINKFFSDKQMVQHIRELDLSNRRVLNWQMDDQLQQLISICPQLQTLHILNCEVSYQRLQCILQQAPKLTALSWTLRHLTSEDVRFLLKSSNPFDGICLKNIKHLHVEAHQSLSYFHELEYLLSCCKYLEALEIYMWQIEEVRDTELVFSLPSYNPLSSTFTQDILQHLHSLTVVAMGSTSDSCSSLHYELSCKEELSNFFFSVGRRKSRETEWKKLWLSPPVGISRVQDLFQLADYSVPLREDYRHDLKSLEAVTVHADQSVDAMRELETLFQRIGDNTVRSLHLCQPTSQTNSILELCEPILRVGGHTLQFLRLSVNPKHVISAKENIVLHMLFSNCLNITELDLLGCYFDKDVCEPLSKLRHLSKVQLNECAISSKQNLSTENQVEISKANLWTFVENCQNITHFDLRSCSHDHVQFSCGVKDGDLLVLSKFKNLKSLTLCQISGITQWTFLQNILEHCQFLTMLRISGIKHYNNFNIAILLKSAKFLKHLALEVPDVDFGSKCFWDLLSYATNLQRLCIRSDYSKSINVPFALEMVKRLPQLHVLHLHSIFVDNAEVVRNQMMTVLEDEKSDCRFSFELVVGYSYVGPKAWILKKALPLNEVELCRMTPILAIPSC